MPCRITRRRLWTHRMLLEQMKSADSCFVTLTYSEENIPDGATLNPEDPRNWLKKLRKSLGDLRIRYFLVGEYGEQSDRPHYHAALFGIGTEYTGLIDEKWGLGFTYTGDLTKDSAQYVAGYVTKKMTKHDDPRLNGRYPEFARMSLRPGIGATATEEIAAVLQTDFGLNTVVRDHDVPMSLNCGRRAMPLGRYLRRKIREKIGHEPTIKEEAIAIFEDKMQKLYEETFAEKQTTERYKKMSVKEILLDKNQQKVLNQESKMKVYSKKLGVL